MLSRSSHPGLLHLPDGDHRPRRHARPASAVLARTGGADGNERLTAATAVVLLVLLAVEGVDDPLPAPAPLGARLRRDAADPARRAQARHRRLPLRALLRGQPPVPGEGPAAPAHARARRPGPRRLDDRPVRDRRRAARRRAAPRDRARAAQGELRRLVRRDERARARLRAPRAGARAGGLEPLGPRERRLPPERRSSPARSCSG